MKRIRILGTVGGFLAILVLTVYAWRLVGAGAAPSADELAETALTAESPQRRDAAAASLAGMDATARPQMARVLNESNQPTVRAAVIQGLAAQWDYDTVPLLMGAVEDSSPLVAGRAGAAVERLLGMDYRFRCDDPPAERQAKIKMMRDDWELLRNSPKLEQWKQRLAEKKS